MENYKKHDRVVVSATATGTGNDMEGTVEDVQQFLGKTLVSVKYDTPDVCGRKGIVLSNLNLMHKEEQNVRRGGWHR